MKQNGRKSPSEVVVPCPQPQRPPDSSVWGLSRGLTWQVVAGRMPAGYFTPETLD